MAAKKTSKKEVAGAPVEKTPVVKKTVAKKAPAKKVVAKKAPAKKAVAAKEVISQDRFYAMVSEAAYFASQNDGNKKSSSEYWLDAEEAVRAKFDVA